MNPYFSPNMVTKYKFSLQKKKGHNQIYPLSSPLAHFPLSRSLSLSSFFFFFSFFFLFLSACGLAGTTATPPSSGDTCRTNEFPTPSNLDACDSNLRQRLTYLERCTWANKPVSFLTCFLRRHSSYPATNHCGLLGSSSASRPYPHWMVKHNFFRWPITMHSAAS